MAEKLLRVDEAAERLGFKPATLRARILRRQIAYVKLSRSVRIKESVIDRMIADGEVPVQKKRG